MCVCAWGRSLPFRGAGGCGDGGNFHLEEGECNGFVTIYISVISLSFLLSLSLFLSLSICSYHSLLSLFLSLSLSLSVPLSLPSLSFLINTVKQQDTGPL